eukprot:4426775-Karenia_brevis.AAC.1
MAQQSLFAYSVPKAKVELARHERLAREEELNAMRSSEAARIGLAWPQKWCKKQAGRPSRQSRWLDALYKELNLNCQLPDNVEISVPAWWNGGSLTRSAEDVRRDMDEFIAAMDE